jgi:hypothetical protein
VQKSLLSGGSLIFQMGYARNRPKFLHEKLRRLREHLNVDEPNMAEKLRSEIASQSKREIEIKRHRISDFELGRSEPDLLMILAYARLGKVRMDSIIDDDVSVPAFRERLGKEFRPGKTAGQLTNKRVKA